MEGFCRTCGKTVNIESCINIFSTQGRQLLHLVRTISNCWVENVIGFPIYMCNDCHTLLKKLSTFRKRCVKIEAFLTRRKNKFTNDGISPAILQEACKVTADPLRIEEEPVNIKEEPTGEEHYNLHEEDAENVQHQQTESEDYDVASLPFDGATQEPQVVDVPAIGHAQQPKLEPNKAVRSKLESRKYTMRVGKRTMYIKLTDEQQPKRIVDRERQWASARPCICEHCGRQFKDGSNLNVHLLRHTGTKNYECKQCNEKCYTLHLLRRHQLKHTEGPYECTFCGLQYSTNSSRVRHEREACKKGRAPQSKTEVIKRGERTFHCDVCDLWFLRAGNLTQHLNSSNHIANERRKNKRFQLKQKES
ncbi:zinc finger protein 420 isoform X1 [Drosophila sulfurigaster albostrigata]|uniref:zinc finger protein 420 isoform X1 n=1 Tax=Drosophila sulfurigaster albostrigata TaxID=89887 RepID=UPI002D219685|nr:zinc finger protein 420 isoform X1 [Drosophila sulfurigaster albostrigata]